MTTLDVTRHGRRSKVGDEVEFLGDHVTLEEVAALAGTNAYEILTGLAPCRAIISKSAA